MTGTLSPCGATWCLASVVLDLGSSAQLAAAAAHDYDGDGALEANRDELAGLAGTQVSLRVAAGTVPVKVYVVNGVGYRNADGSFA